MVAKGTKKTSLIKKQPLKAFAETNSLTFVVDHNFPFLKLVCGSFEKTAGVLSILFVPTSPNPPYFHKLS